MPAQEDLPPKSQASMCHSAQALNKIRELNERAYKMQQPSDAVRQLCKPLVLNDNQLRQIMGRMENSFAEGLHPDTAKKAAVKMLPTYIRAVSVSEERGKFLALDLGGTHFRVLLIELEGTKSGMKSKIFDVPDHIQKGTGTALFDHIAACLADFMEEQQVKGKERLPLGFTFSFPCRQEGLSSAFLVNWTKGFNVTDVIDKDVVELLHQACTRRGDIDIDVVAVLNDTTGTMLNCSFFQQHCYIGVIVGTGCNLCYMESLDKIPKLKDKINPEKDGLPAEMCINTELGAFGDDGKLDDFLTKWDKQVDEASINPGKQRYEKAISGMYMGEIVRHVLKDLADHGALFGGKPDGINVAGCISAKHVSGVEKQMQQEDEKSPLSKVEQVLRQKIGVPSATPLDCANVAYVCSLVSTRAAHLCACAIATLLKRMSRELCTVGVDGSVYRFHPTFKYLLDEKIGQLAEGNQYRLVLSEDGSGRGAAVAASVAQRMKRITQEHAKRKDEGAEAGTNKGLKQ